MKTGIGKLLGWLSLAAIFSFNATATTFYVDVKSVNPSSPYSNWSTAATDIQSAIDAASDGDLILVTNGYSIISNYPLPGFTTNYVGVYKTGGRVVYGSLTNRVVINKAVTVQSVNGPLLTIIQGNLTTGNNLGNNAIRCVYMTNGATLIGFTLTNGATRFGGDVVKEQSGGGIWCESTNAFIENCVLTTNAGNNVTGAYSGTYSNCLFIKNGSASSGLPLLGGILNASLFNCVIASNAGCGVVSSYLNNCTIVGNNRNVSQLAGGGAYASVLESCVISNNSAGYGAGAWSCQLTNCLVISNLVAGNFGYGGGVFGGTADNCTFIGNSAYAGGAATGGTVLSVGTYPITLNNCIISNNTSMFAGAGAYSIGNGGSISFPNCVLNKCQLIGNYVSNAPVGGGGGGVYSSTLIDCILINNYSRYGGGVAYGILNNCTLTNNSASSGGGAYTATLNDCTLAYNVATSGGGASFGNLNNCIVYYNQGDNCFNGSLNYCCVVPYPPSGVGNITNEPIFVDLNAGDFHLMSNSPCINSGNNAVVTFTNDFDGNSRIVGGTVDIGAYEFQSPASTLSYAWAQQYGLPTDGTADGADTDGDGMNNWQEWKSSTVPTNAASVLQLASPSNSLSGMIVTWQSVGGVNYYLQRGTNLAAQPAFTSIQSNLVGQAGTTSYTDPTATNTTPYFYRVGVQ